MSSGLSLRMIEEEPLRRPPRRPRGHGHPPPERRPRWPGCSPSLSDFFAPGRRDGTGHEPTPARPPPPGRRGGRGAVVLSGACPRRSSSTSGRVARPRSRSTRTGRGWPCVTPWRTRRRRPPARLVRIVLAGTGDRLRIEVVVEPAAPERDCPLGRPEPRPVRAHPGQRGRAPRPRPLRRGQRLRADRRARPDFRGLRRGRLGDASSTGRSSRRSPPTPTGALDAPRPSGLASAVR